MSEQQSGFFRSMFSAICSWRWRAPKIERSPYQRSSKRRTRSRTMKNRRPRQTGRGHRRAYLQNGRRPSCRFAYSRHDGIVLAARRAVKWMAKRAIARAA